MLYLLITVDILCLCVLYIGRYKNKIHTISFNIAANVCVYMSMLLRLKRNLEEFYT